MNIHRDKTSLQFNNFLDKRLDEPIIFIYRRKKYTLSNIDIKDYDSFFVTSVSLISLY